jgi:hypothetical protein
VAADLDRASDRGPVADLRHRELQQLGRAREAVVGGAVEVRPGADDRHRPAVLELGHAVAAAEGERALALVPAQRPRQEGQVVEHGEQHRPVDAEAAEDLDLKGDGAGDVARVAGDLAVALQRVHVAEVDAAPGQLHRADDDRPGAHGVDVHVAVGLVLLELGGAQRKAVRRAHEEGAEVAGVVRVRHGHRRRRAELAHERPHPRG